MAGLIRFVFKTNKNDLSLKRIAGTAILASVITLPILYVFLLKLIPGDVIQKVIIGEAIVMAIEAIIFWKLLKLSPKRAIIISIIANIASMVIGTLLLLVFGF
jgi:hypothetical protein